MRCDDEWPSGPQVRPSSLLALLAVLHAPPIRARVFTWVIAQLESRYQLTLTADAFRYNIVTGTVTLDNVRLAAHGAAQPFFTATRVRADVPLSAYAGRLILDDVEVDGGRVEMLTDANGVSNLPASGSQQAAARGSASR